MRPDRERTNITPDIYPPQSDMERRFRHILRGFEYRRMTPRRRWRMRELLLRESRAIVGDMPLQVSEVQVSRDGDVVNVEITLPPCLAEIFIETMFGKGAT